VAASDLLRLRPGAEHLHRLGPRPLCEFIIQMQDGRDAFDLLNEYRQITPMMLLVTGADRFPVHLQEAPR
jgi:hypothetical protein